MIEALRYLDSTRKKPKPTNKDSTGSVDGSGTGKPRNTGTGGKSSQRSKSMPRRANSADPSAFGKDSMLDDTDSRSAMESYLDDEKTDGSTNSLQKGPVYARQTIWGQNIINCRTFNLDAKRSFEYLGSYISVGAVPVYPLPEIAFLGRSNVGKSSLLNCITGSNKNIAVASKTPGRTRCINQFKCKDAQGDICTFVDLPGYGFAKVAKDKQEDISGFLRGYLENRSNLRLAVLLVDIRREPQVQDLNMFQVPGVAALCSYCMSYSIVSY